MNSKFLALLFVFTLIASCPFCFSQSGPKEVLSPREVKITTGFGKDLDKDVKKDGLHGSISAVIIKKGRVIWADAVGYSSLDKDTPADTGTIYRIASITKTFTATVLMQLVEEGKVRLDDLVETYVPEVKSLRGYSSSTKITLRELASHTSGLNREPDMPYADASLGPVDQWENKLLSCIPRTSFNSGPGEQFLYSNMGYALLGLALERASGLPYTRLVEERIFRPLHMDNTFFEVPEDKRSKLAQGMEINKEGRVNAQLPLQQVAGMGYRVPNGGIWSTPTDLAKFVIALTGGYSLLKRESLRQMLDIPSGGKNYGLGLMIMHNRELDLIGHNGSDPGYTSQCSIEPNSGDAVILMRNYNVGETRLEEAALELLERL
jgi:CubicO group peptidase (beta-lactamase class C family)